MRLTLSIPRRLAPPRAGFRRRLVLRLLALLDLLVHWQSRWRQRRRLEDFQDWQRRDLNLGETAIRREAAKPFWRP